METIDDYKKIYDIHLAFVRGWMDAAMDASPDGYFTVFGRKGINKMTEDSLIHLESKGFLLTEDVKKAVAAKCERAVVHHEHYILD